MLQSASDVQLDGTLPKLTAESWAALHAGCGPARRPRISLFRQAYPCAAPSACSRESASGARAPKAPSSENSASLTDFAVAVGLSLTAVLGVALGLGGYLAVYRSRAF